MQLDFDLHRAPEPKPEPKIHTVSELTRRIRDAIEGRVGEVWVEGEISNLRKQASGHQYFTLKDNSSQLSCVLFGGTASSLRGLKLTDGQCIQAFGAVTVYEPRGQYQMIVRLAQLRGEGALQAKFEALKRLLASEGLFDSERKRALPRFPRRVGLITSPTGAAIRDFLKVLHRRHPGIEVILNPVRVQGKGASLEIARAIREFGEAEKYGLPRVDVLVLTRGGGSIEDLWEFNEEAVARALAASPIPTLNAVGHEIDFTIADFVADMRAPTPSAAAEILAADRTEVLSRLRQDHARINRACKSRLEMLTTRLAGCRQSALFREPARRLTELSQTLDRHGDSLRHETDLALERARNTLAQQTARLKTLSPASRIEEARLRGGLKLQRLTEILTRELTACRTRLDRASGILNALNPHATLSRGYTITLDAENRPLTSASQVKTGQLLRTRFEDGETESIAR